MKPTSRRKPLCSADAVRTRSATAMSSLPPNHGLRPQFGLGQIRACNSASKNSMSGAGQPPGRTVTAGHRAEGGAHDKADQHAEAAGRHLRLGRRVLREWKDCRGSSHQKDDPAEEHPGRGVVITSSSRITPPSTAATTAAPAHPSPLELPIGGSSRLTSKTSRTTTPTRRPGLRRLPWPPPPPRSVLDRQTAQVAARRSCPPPPGICQRRYALTGGPCSPGAGEVVPLQAAQTTSRHCAGRRERSMTPSRVSDDTVRQFGDART